MGLGIIMRKLATASTRGPPQIKLLALKLLKHTVNLYTMFTRLFNYTTTSLQCVWYWSLQTFPATAKACPMMVKVYSKCNLTSFRLLVSDSGACTTGLSSTSMATGLRFLEAALTVDMRFPYTSEYLACCMASSVKRLSSTV